MVEVIRYQTSFRGYNSVNSYNFIIQRNMAIKIQLINKKIFKFFNSPDGKINPLL